MILNDFRIESIYNVLTQIKDTSIIVNLNYQDPEIEYMVMSYHPELHRIDIEPLNLEKPIFENPTITVPLVPASYFLKNCNPNKCGRILAGLDSDDEENLDNIGDNLNQQK